MSTNAHARPRAEIRDTLRRMQGQELRVLREVASEARATIAGLTARVSEAALKRWAVEGKADAAGVRRYLDAVNDGGCWKSNVAAVERFLAALAARQAG